MVFRLFFIGEKEMLICPQLPVSSFSSTPPTYCEASQVVTVRWIKPSTTTEALFSFHWLSSNIFNCLLVGAPFLPKGRFKVAKSICPSHSILTYRCHLPDLISCMIVTYVSFRYLCIIQYLCIIYVLIGDSAKATYCFRE